MYAKMYLRAFASWTPRKVVCRLEVGLDSPCAALFDKRLDMGFVDFVLITEKVLDQTPQFVVQSKFKEKHCVFCTHTQPLPSPFFIQKNWPTN
jgi:hypothetical protein